MIPRPPLFNPHDWYWIVAGSTTQVYSSKIKDFVLVTDSAYQTWLSLGRIPTKIDTEESLGEVQAVHSLRPIPVGVLQGYEGAIVNELETMKIMKAYSLVVLDEINILRAQHSLPARTVNQLKAAVRAKIT